MIYFFCFVQHQGLHALELLKMLQLPKPAYEINFGGHYFPTMLGIFFFFLKVTMFFQLVRRYL